MKNSSECFFNFFSFVFFLLNVTASLLMLIAFKILCLENLCYVIVLTYIRKVEDKTLGIQNHMLNMYF